jgi:hypothetical protein
LDFGFWIKGFRTFARSLLILVWFWQEDLPLGLTQTKIAATITCKTYTNFTNFASRGILGDENSYQFLAGAGGCPGSKRTRCHASDGSNSTDQSGSHLDAIDTSIPKSLL